VQSVCSRTRGGDPAWDGIGARMDIVLPARAGVDPIVLMSPPSVLGVLPYARG